MTARHIAILGHSIEGAALCWTEIARHSTRLGHLAHPDLTMDCISFEHAMSAWDRDDYAQVRTILTRSLDRLARAGANFFVCPDNTAHLALETEGPPLPLPGLSIIEVVADQAQESGYQRVAILGTRFTMDGKLYPGALSARGIEAVRPSAEDRALVDRSIFTELVHGVVSERVESALLDLAGRLAADGCDAIAAVCTEIPLVLTTGNSPLPVLDSTRLLARAAAETALGTRQFPDWQGGPVR